MGHQPITYIRQLITVCLSPAKYFESGSNGVKSHGNSHVKEVVDILAEEAGGGERERLRQLVEGLSPAREGRAADVLDEIPRDVKERANVLLNSLGGRSLGMCVHTCFHSTARSLHHTTCTTYRERERELYFTETLLKVFFFRNIFDLKLFKCCGFFKTISLSLSLCRVLH